MRTATAFIGTVSLSGDLPGVRTKPARAVRQGLAARIGASILNVVAFSLFSAFAQIAAATSRVAILTYAMPIWTLVLGWAILSERPSRIQSAAIALCAVGLVILISPVAMATTGIPWGLLFAVGSGFSWAAGTVYLKWARIDGDPIGLASWQITIAFLHYRGMHVAVRWPSAFRARARRRVAGRGFYRHARQRGRLRPMVCDCQARAGADRNAWHRRHPGGRRRLHHADHRRSPQRWPIRIGFAFIFAASLCAQIPASAFRRVTA